MIRRVREALSERRERARDVVAVEANVSTWDLTALTPEFI